MRLFKNLFFCCFPVFFCVSTVWAQCPQGVVYLDTQADVDNFAVLYPNCTEISSNFNIGKTSVASDYGSSDITDL